MVDGDTNSLEKTFIELDKSTYRHLDGNTNELREVWILGIGVIMILDDNTWNRAAKMDFDEGLIEGYDASSGVELKSYGYQPNSTWSTDSLFLKQADAYYF